MDEQARREAPREACGILVGARDGEAWIVARAIEARNVHDTPLDAFLVDPEGLLRAADAAANEGLDVIGFYHSHPRGPAAPSARDAREAGWPDAAHVILAPNARGAWVWRAQEARFEPCRIEVAQ